MCTIATFALMLIIVMLLSEDFYNQEYVRGQILEIKSTSKNSSNCINLGTNMTGAGRQGLSPYSGVIDGDYHVRWSNEGNVSRIQLDFGKPVVICSINIAWDLGSERSYDFYVNVSGDRESYEKTVYAGKIDGNVSLELDNISGKYRYAKVVVIGNTFEDGDWGAIPELVVNGYFPKDDLPPPNGTPLPPEKIPTVIVSTDKQKYVTGQIVNIIGNVSDGDGLAEDTNVDLEVRKLNDSMSGDDWDVPLLAEYGNFTHPLIDLGSGMYNVTASGTLNGTKVNDSTQFEVASEPASSPIVSINTNQPKYALGQIVRVFGNISDGTGQNLKPVNLDLETIQTDSVVLLWGFIPWPPGDPLNKTSKTTTIHEAFLLTENGTYTDTITNLKPGKYKVFVNASIGGKNATDWTTFEVWDWWGSQTWWAMLVALMFFFFLIATIFMIGREVSKRKITQVISVLTIVVLIGVLLLYNIDFYTKVVVSVLIIVAVAVLIIVLVKISSASKFSDVEKK